MSTATMDSTFEMWAEEVVCISPKVATSNAWRNEFNATFVPTGGYADRTKELEDTAWKDPRVDREVLLEKTFSVSGELVGRYRKALNRRHGNRFIASILGAYLNDEQIVGQIQSALSGAFYEILSQRELSGNEATRLEESERLSLTQMIAYRLSNLSQKDSIAVAKDLLSDFSMSFRGAKLVLNGGEVTVDVNGFPRIKRTRKLSNRELIDIALNSGVKIKNTVRLDVESRILSGTSF